MKITEEEKQQVYRLFPSLSFKEESENIFLSGDLKFAARFVKKRKRYELLNHNQSYQPDRYLLEDSYKIEINLSETVNPYREVKNTDGRILDLATNLKKIPSDLHVYTYPPEQKNKVCLVGYFDENENIRLIQFLCEVVLPFFYDQSFYERYHIWPRGGFSHGCLGLFENYHGKIKNCHNVIEKKDLTEKCLSLIKMFRSQNLDKKGWEQTAKYLKKKKIKHYWKCISCSCTSRFIDCHPKAFYGLRSFRKNIKKYSLNF